MRIKQAVKYSFYFVLCSAVLFPLLQLYFLMVPLSASTVYEPIGGLRGDDRPLGRCRAFQR